MQCKLLRVGLGDTGREATVSAAEEVLLEDDRRLRFDGILNRTAFRQVPSIISFSSIPPL